MTRYGQLAKAGEVSSVVRTDGILAARSETAANLILGGRQEALGSSGIALVADDIPNYGLNPNSFDTALQFERTGTPTIAPGYSNAGSFARADDVLAVRSNEVVLTKYKEKNSGLTPIFPRDTSPNFYLFTKEYALQIWTFDARNKPDMKKKKLMLDVMVPQGKKAYVGPEGNFVEATGRTSEATYVTRSPAMVVTTNTEIMQMTNPCGRELKK